MGHKVHPIGFRIGVIRDWQAKWYADSHYGEFVREDLKLRQAIAAGYRQAGISQLEISRQANEVFITIHTARPGVVIGRGGQRVDEMRLRLERIIGKRVRLNILEVPQPELDATLVARTVAEQIERRVAYRRAMKQAISRAVQAGAKGVRISCAGRLGGAEIARRQTMHDGQVPLHTLRADIDYGFVEAVTTLGRIGVKVWIYKGDILPEPKLVEVEEMPAELVTSDGKEVESAIGREEMPAEPAASEEAESTVAAEPVETPTEPVSQSVEAAPVVATKKKRTRARARVKAAPSAEPAENSVKPAADIVTEAESSTTKEEEKDVTTEAGETSQGS
jgi:small subunit ribosomal protein S3